MNPATDCGIDPRDSLLVAYLPKLDAVLQEMPTEQGALMSLDGVALDIVGPKRVRWWQVRRAAGDEGLALPEVVWQGKAANFVGVELFSLLEKGKPDEAKLYMRAYSHGPWICIEQDQLDKVYKETNGA